MHRRLLALDYVLDYPELLWLPTEAEKLACFDALDVPREELQSRTYGGLAEARRWFPDKHPIAIDTQAKSAVFVYVDLEEQTPQGLKSWWRAHDVLWRRLSAAGFQVKVAHITSNSDLSDRVYRGFQWVYSRRKNAVMSPDEARQWSAEMTEYIDGYRQELKDLQATAPRLAGESDTRKARDEALVDKIIKLLKERRKVDRYIEQYSGINRSISAFQARVSKRIRPGTENRDPRTAADGDPSFYD